MLELWLGMPLTDVRVSLLAGRAHEKHTEGGDFRQATYRAIRQALFCAENVLLEPYYRFTAEAEPAHSRKDSFRSSHAARDL